MLKGKRIKVPQWIHSRKVAVHVMVEAVIPEEDPSEPCLEPSTLRWLDEVQDMADEGKWMSWRSMGRCM